MEEKYNEQIDKTIVSAKSVNQYRDIASQALEIARKIGATSAEVALNIEIGQSITVRLGEIETVEQNRDKGIGITVYFDKSKGSASTTDFSKQAINETVTAACDLAKYTEADPCAGLADPELMATDIPDLDLYHPWHASTEELIEMAIQCETIGRDVDPRIINSDGAYIASHDGIRLYANTHGFMGNYASSRHSLGCTLIAEESGKMQRDHWYSLSRFADKLDDVKIVGEKAANRTIQRLNPHKLKTQQTPVIFHADIARGLLGHFIRAISGGALYRNASFLLDNIGKAVFPDHVKIDERPHLKGALASAPFDSEGVATTEHDIVREGVLQGYVLDSYAGRKLNMVTTGNSGGVHNLFISNDNKTLEDLLNEMQQGVLVTEVMGQGVNIVTGDYSRGAAGFWIEGGEIQYPIEEFTLAGNLRDMFSQLIAVGNDIDRRGSIATGSWLIENMMVAGE